MKRALVEAVDKFDASSNGNIPKLVSFASGDDIPTGAKFATFRNSEDGSHVLVAETDRLSYVNRAPPEQLMLAVVNRSTGTARLVPLQGYHLSPALHADADGTDAAATSAAPTRLDADAAFGLARWQRRATKSRRLAVAGGAASVVTAVSAAVQDVPDGPVAARPAAAAAETGLIPPQDGAAADRRHVYRRQDVVPPRLWTQLAVADAQFQAALGKHAGSYEYIVKYSAIFEEAADEERSILITYAFYMLRLLHYLQGMKVKKSWKQLLVPEPILEHMRQSFMERSHEGWDRSDRLVDKLVCYFLVVALWIHDYVMDLSELSGAARIPVKKLAQYCAALGMTVAGSRAELRVPLKSRRVPGITRRRNKVAAM